jgi:ribosomal protein S18 acetylase RimI-like enzyme
MHFICREIEEKDIPCVAEIRTHNSGSAAPWSARIKNYLAGIVNPQCALPQRIIYVAVHNDEIIGFVASHLSTRFGCDGELQWIDTKIEFRRKGVASHLVRFLAQWFILKKAYKICVDPGNQIARALYQKNGALMLNEHWMLWADVRTIVR